MLEMYANINNLRIASGEAYPSSPLRGSKWDRVRKAVRIKAINEALRGGYDTLKASNGFNRLKNDRHMSRKVDSKGYVVGNPNGSKATLMGIERFDRVIQVKDRIIENMQGVTNTPPLPLSYLQTAQARLEYAMDRIKHTLSPAIDRKPKPVSIPYNPNIVRYKGKGFNMPVCSGMTATRAGFYKTSKAIERIKNSTDCGE